jgi:membrane protease YdiL (CAAX protease family)
MTSAMRDPRHPAQVAIAAGIFAAGVTGFAIFAARLSGACSRLTACLLFALFFLPCPALAVERWRTGLQGWATAAPHRWSAVPHPHWATAAPRLRVGFLWMIALGACSAHAAACGAAWTADLLRCAMYTAAILALVPFGYGAADAENSRRETEGQIAALGDWATTLRLGVAVLALWLPAELGRIGHFHLPAGAPGGLDATRLLAFDLGLVLFVAVRPIGNIGYRFDFRGADLGTAAIGFVCFAGLAVPLGTSLGFIRYGWRLFDPAEWGLILLSTYFLVALPEELLFRGLIQNLLEQRSRAGRAGALAVTAVVFGASHLNNRATPDWRYVLLATFAGLAYGWVWMRTRRVTASALTHAAVDFVWVLMFRAM